MGQISIEDDETIYLESIDEEADLNLWPGLRIINPPQSKAIVVGSGIQIVSITN